MIKVPDPGVHYLHQPGAKYPHWFVVTYGDVQKEIAILKWCQEEFGSDTDIWTRSTAVIHIADETCAFKFRMTWC